MTRHEKHVLGALLTMLLACGFSGAGFAAWGYGDPDRAWVLVGISAALSFASICISRSGRKD